MDFPLKCLSHQKLKKISLQNYICTCSLHYLFVHVFNSHVHVISLTLFSSIKVQTKPVSSAVDAGAQIQQLINIEVQKPFFQPPLLEVKLTLVIIHIPYWLGSITLMLCTKLSCCYIISFACFSVGGVPQSHVLKLPLMIHKLSEPTEMTSTDFFTRWKNLPRLVVYTCRSQVSTQILHSCMIQSTLLLLSTVCCSGDEAQSIFNANFPIDKEAAETKVHIYVRYMFKLLWICVTNGLFHIHTVHYACFIENRVSLKLLIFYYIFVYFFTCS